MSENFEEIPGYLHALVGDTVVQPESCGVKHHGTAIVSEAEFKIHGGLPAKGTDIDLIRHVEPPPQWREKSAFIGTVPFPRSPINDDAGAVYWAGDGGLLYQIHDWQGYDINSLLEGRIPDGMGHYRGPKMPAEQETALPARVPARFVKRIGYVRRSGNGLRVVWPDV